MKKAIVSPFEYTLPFISILVGLAVADLSVSLHRLLRARSTVLWDWLPLSAAFMVLLLILQFWWSFYFFGRTEVFSNYAAFLLLLALLVNMFLLASAALPDEVPKEGIDLRDFYAGNQQYFWLLFGLFMLLTVANQFMLGFTAETEVKVVVGRLLLHSLPNFLVAGLFLSLALVRNRTYHSVLVPLLLVFLGWHWSRLQLSM